MLQQLLITLPTEASTWVKLHHPKKAKEGAPLWEDVTKMFEGEGETRLMEGGSRKEGGLIHVCRQFFYWEDLGRCKPHGSFPSPAVLSQDADETQQQSLKDEVTSGPPTAESQELLTFKDISVDFTQEEWGQLAPAHRSLLQHKHSYSFLTPQAGYQLSKPSVISQLEKGEEPWITEKEGPGDPSSDLKSKTETNMSTAKNDILQEQLYHGIMMERFMRDDVIYSTLRKVSKYDDKLERHQETHGRDVIQAISIHKKRGQETNKFGENINLYSSYKPKPGT
ncbi:hypothetical protein HPG69_014513 [Diceros bicornis minor]|uniref:Uncharacterized protein n=1 Tax=Diceros bicornis minor TaxID=77932 RepID=A0A7J7E3N6_DICBM|nr:hypothetical protein HPG69_014513 [Diceros bicornis minor]